MKRIAFIDTEVDVSTGIIGDFGVLSDDYSKLHSQSAEKFLAFIKDYKFLCGHNVIHHDLKCIARNGNFNLANFQVIDTLYLSPLLFPMMPYHNLVKDDKLQTEELNNPLNDAIKARDLFYDEIDAFKNLDEGLKKIYFALLGKEREFKGFFAFNDFSADVGDLEELIRIRFSRNVCENTDISRIIEDHPVELAYALSLINSKSRYSLTPPWVIRNYPDVERIFYLLRNNPCLCGCSYCDQSLDAKIGLKSFFGYESYRSYGGEALQEKAVNAAINNKSLVAVFPTGGGKSITFQVPALMSGLNVKGLTVVISPLQSLMKDQVDNLENSGITDAVTINGLLDPIARQESFERVQNGKATLLYISPESLRSRSIEHLLLGRNVVRFVIDEAHCFSSWGQDFRVDYLYIGDFIKSLQEKKNLEYPIPVSCFTATAKQNVIEDIKNYFKSKLNLELETFSAKASRTNLTYKVIPQESQESKYNKLRDLIDGKKCPTIIYVSRTKRAWEIAERLSNDGYHAKPYHGKMDKQEKSENQDAFIRGDVDIMVATSAFGMGVDKKDVGMVIHYELSDSLENYVQEAGRAGRDENITADCYALFNEDDLDKHFILLNQTKLHIKEIQQVWRAIKSLTKFRSKVSNSALEIARQAGWDDSVVEIETRVTTAISALEEAGYLKRGQNMPRIFANSILSKNAMEAIQQIELSERFSDQQKMNATRIIKKLFSTKSRKLATDDTAESRIDYIADQLALCQSDVITAINLMREEHILADTKDLTAFIRRGEEKNRSLNILKPVAELEKFLATQFDVSEKSFHIKGLNESATEFGCKKVTPKMLKTIINFWHIKNWIKCKRHNQNNHFSTLSCYSQDELKQKLEARHTLAIFIVNYLFEKSQQTALYDEIAKEQVLVEFSVHELKDEFEQQNALLQLKTTVSEVEDALFYLSRIDAIKIEGGFLVIYNKLTIERLEKDSRINYKNEDYKSLKRFYDNRMQQIHIVGEYAKKMIRNYKEALQFVEDYFHLNYSSFLNKYFKGNRKEDLKRNVTPAKFRRLFGELSPSQLSIINDRSQYIAVAAGPGSGKTRVLVHKLASLYSMEDVKHEQMLMITFSRAAASEFKKRLLDLIGNAACFIDIKTFHSYCFDILGRIGSIEKSENVISEAVQKIRAGEVETNRITKTVLVIDEAQDMDQTEFELITSLMEKNDDMRVIAVGDDDQNIYEFRGASSKYLEQFITEKKAKKVELVENYRSRANLVEFTNQFVKTIPHRLKETPIVPNTNKLGLVKVIRYSAQNLLRPFLEYIQSAELRGTTSILTKTNQEAIQISGILNHRGFAAKLIQTNDSFNLYDLEGIRFFISQLQFQEDKFTITDEIWKEAKNKLKKVYGESSQIKLCLNLINEFEGVNPKKKFQTDFELFVRESKLEDFATYNGAIISVSTIHKAKGREFDNVFIMLNDFKVDTDEAKRQLYVAMTRAKENLTIHLNGRFLDNIHCDNIERQFDSKLYAPLNLLVIQLTYKDIWLDFFYSRQKEIVKLKSGDHLAVNEEGCLDRNGYYVIRFSKAFKEKVADYKNRGFKLVRSRINLIIHWKKQDTENEIKILLPEVKLSRR